LESIREVSIDEFLQTIEAMSMMEHNFSAEEMEEIKARGQQGCCKKGLMKRNFTVPQQTNPY
jgi:hypothetical protein